MEPSVPQNVYYMHVPLFVLDAIRLFQDHPRFQNGLTEIDIVELLQQQKFASGDLMAQVESAIRSLKMKGYIRYIADGYRTLGPLAKLATARGVKQRCRIWNKIQEKM